MSNTVYEAVTEVCLVTETDSVGLAVNVRAAKRGNLSKVIQYAILLGGVSL